MERDNPVEVRHANVWPVSRPQGRPNSSAANHLWVATDTDSSARYRGVQPIPEQLLASIMRRHDTDRLWAHQMLEDLQDEVGSLRRLGAVFEDAARKATEDWISRLVHKRAALPTPIDEDHEWPSLVDRVRGLALDGHDVEALVHTAVKMRPFDESRSAAGVMHWRSASSRTGRSCGTATGSTGSPRA